MSERGMIGDLVHQIFGPRAPDFCAGLALVVGIGLAFMVSISVMPELNWRALAQSTATHKEAAIALRQRDEIADRLDAHRSHYSQLLAEDKPDADKPAANKPATDKPATDKPDTSAPGISPRSRLDNLLDLIRLEQVNLRDAEANLKLMRNTPNGAAAIDDLQMARYSGIGDYFFWATPGQLVLILTLLMGALGGIISVARAFVLSEDKQPKASDYIIRPLLGAVIAFVIYMLVQVTQAMIATGASADQLNPYPVVLIAVVAGFMATDAVDAIERWGKALFGRISAAPFGNSVSELSPKLVAERNRLLTATSKLQSGAPVPADAATPTQDEKDAKAAYDEANAALTDANATLANAEAAIDRLNANPTNTTVAAANSALSDLVGKVTKAVSLTDSIK